MGAKKLYLIIFSLFLVLGFLITQFFRLSNQQTYAENNNLKENLIGNFFRSLSNAKEKSLIISWEDTPRTIASGELRGGQKDIPLDQIIDHYLRQYTGKNELRINFPKLEKILNEKLSSEVKKEPVNAKLEYDSINNRIKEFSLPQNGRRLNTSQTINNIVRNLTQAQLITSLVFEETAPEITQNSLSRLGLTTLLAKGESDFKGSSASRVRNIEIGAEKFNGLLVKPGEEFSFNDNLGEVDAANGYLSELVIKSGKLIPEYGGGLCQVSTTLFRATALSGLPILERRPHSFPVKYYNPQGFDATIYPGVTDLRFKNDTDGHLLIQNHIEGTKLIFEIFGSANGRVTELVGPKILEQNANGSMKTLLTRKISAADGTVKEDSFWSNYKSPAAFPLERNPLE